MSAHGRGLGIGAALVVGIAMLGCGGVEVPEPEGNDPDAVEEPEDEDGEAVDADGAAVDEDANPDGERDGTMPKAPEGPLKLLQPVPDGDACRFTVQPGGEVLATVKAPCAGWSIAANPKDPSDVVAAIDDAPPVRIGGTMPDLPEGERDGVGFDADGNLVVILGSFVDPQLDEAAQKAWVEVDGTRIEVPYDPEPIFSSILCRAYQHADGAWAATGKPAVVELGEGSSRPYCYADGIPVLQGLRRPADDAQIPYTDRSEVPDALAKRGEEGASWVTLDAHPEITVAGYWFEGLRMHLPVLREVDGAFVPLEGLGEAGPSVSLASDDGRLLVCVSDGPRATASVYEAASGYARVWTGAGGCPVFWDP